MNTNFFVYLPFSTDHKKGHVINLSILKHLDKVTMWLLLSSNNHSFLFLF